MEIQYTRYIGVSQFALFTAAKQVMRVPVFVLHWKGLCTLHVVGRNVA